MPKSTLKHPNDFTIFFQPKRMLRLTLYWMAHLLCSVMIMAGYQGQEVSIGLSVVQNINIPCGREGPEGLHLEVFLFGKWSKLLQRKGVKNRELLHAPDGLVPNINQSSRGRLSPY